MFLNFTKTKYIIFRSKTRKIPHDIDSITINNIIIERTESINFLGIIIHESLDWKYHIVNISSKLSRSIGVLYKLKDFLPSRILIYIYNAIILPHLNYCNEIWGNSYRVHTNKIFLLQKRAIRIISNSQYISHTLPIFVQLKTLPLFYLVKFNILMFMYKFHRGILPEIFNNMFKTNDLFHTYPTRNCQNLRKPITHLTIRTHSISFTGVHEWNSVSNELKSSTTLTRFKTLFKRFAFHELSSMTD